jgi:hypothetical protein
MDDVLGAVEAAKKEYDGRSKSKIREWLESFSAGVMYYEKVMDMLVQQHQEYTSLV